MADVRALRPGSPKPIPPPLLSEIEEVLSHRGRDREAKLLHCSNLGVAVATMPPEELFFTLKEMDPDNVPLVLAHARTEQVEFLFDLDLWKKDRVRRGRIVPWLTQLAACGPASLGRWLKHLDLSTLTLLLGTVVHVDVADEDRDPLQELPGRSPFTFDGLYYVSAPEASEPLVRNLLTVLREADADRYQRLLEALTRDVGSELEEQCYEERRKRMAPRGFPEWEESMEVYALLEVGKASDLPLRPGTPEQPGEDQPQVPPRYPLVVAGAAPDLLARAFRRLEGSPALDEFRAELAYLTNKVTAADGLELDRPESFEMALRKVAGYVSMGLEALCGFDECEATRVLERHWLQHLFRLGWTRVREVRGKARRLFDRGWPQGHKERLLFLDSPLPEILEGLLRPHPLWYDAEQGPSSYRLFQRLDEVRQAARLVEKADFLGRFLLAVIDLRLGDLKDSLVGLETDDLKGTTVFLTALVNAALGRTFRFAPVDRNSVREGLERIWGEGARPRRVKPELYDAAVEWSKTVADVPDRDEAHLREFVGECFTLLEEEFGHLAPDEIPDPRFTRGVWIE